jgi:hypothetical protein
MGDFFAHNQTFLFWAQSELDTCWSARMPFRTFNAARLGAGGLDAVTNGPAIPRTLNRPWLERSDPSSRAALNRLPPAVYRYRTALETLRPLRPDEGLHSAADNRSARKRSFGEFAAK